MRVDSGSDNYLKHVARLQSDCVGTVKMTWLKLSGDCHRLNGNAIIRGGNLKLSQAIPKNT